ncbi:MBG domain-containing protein [Treponema sp. R80B11-R83G3]
MKKNFKSYIASVTIIALIAIFGFVMAGCEQPTDSRQPPTAETSITEIPTGTTVNPIASDFNISGTGTVNYDGNPKEVSITPKAGKSQGQITIYYTGIDGTDYAKNTTAPSATGKYFVTFDVAVTEGFNARAGLIAGTLIIKEVFVITDLNRKIDFESDWDNSGYGERSVSWGGYGWTASGVVTTTDDRDRRDGEKSIRLRGNDGDNCRVELDSYLIGIKSIYFDYASYGTHSNGIISVYYQIKGSDWVKVGEVIAPSWDENEGMLSEKFDINQANVRFKIVREGDLANFTSINVDNIIITADSESSFNVVAVDPIASDFNISGFEAIYDGEPKEVSIKSKPGKSQGDITVWYEGIDVDYTRRTDAPSAAGRYVVTFDVTAAAGFNAKNDLSAGTLVIEAINDPHIVVDFEDSAWDGGSYTKRTVDWGGYEWAVSGVVSTTDSNDRKEGDRSVRFRGGNVNDTGDNTNRVELMDYLADGIKSISFDYASYSSHSGGTIIVYYQKEGEEWEEVGKVENIPSWVNGGSKMLNAKFDVNVTGNVRFKIEKLFVGSGSISVNVDNIRITY